MAEEEKVDWVRGPKKANLSDVDVQKIQQAHDERGVSVEVNADQPDQSKVTKTAVEGMPAPNKQDKEK